MSQYKVIIKEEAQADLKSQRSIDLFIAFSKQKSMLMSSLLMGIMMTNSLFITQIFLNTIWSAISQMYLLRAKAVIID